MNIRKFIYATLSLAAFSTMAGAEVVSLSNGDRITGSVLKSTADGILLQTQFGTVVIPQNLVKTIAAESQAEDSAAAQGSAATGEAVASAAAEDPAAPVPEDKDPEWLVAYRNFIKENCPDGWQFRLRGGLDYRKTTSSVFALSANFDVVKEWNDINKFTATAYYLYTTETSVDNITSTTLDKYGVDTTYRRQFDEATNWYLENILSYRKDMVKGIRDQVDEAVVVGYSFDFKRYNLTIDIAPGPAVRYVNANGYDEHWAAMGVLAEDITWKISKLFRFEQSGYMGFSLTNPSKYSAYLRLGFILHADDAMDIALRYSYEYDSINAADAQKSEERLMLSFEFPFGWKY